MVQPDPLAMLQGLIPSIPSGNSLLIVALIGTTIVPYNLFLHADSAKTRWQEAGNLSEARKDTYGSILMGGLITCAIVLTSAVSAPGKDIKGIQELAEQLVPLLGSWAPSVLGIGLFAAGLSSAITAPLAAAYATSGVLGWPVNLKDRRFRWCWMLVLATGMSFALLNLKPIPVIIFAQVANGLLLPIMVGFLLWVMNDRSILGDYANRPITNILGGLVWLISLGLGLVSLGKVLLHS